MSCGRFLSLSIIRRDTAISKRILFVLYEGLPKTVIDTQVLMHVRTMQECLGVKFEVWAFACSDRLYQESLSRRAEAEQIAGCPVSVYRALRPAIPASRPINRSQFAKLLGQKECFDVIHARTDYTAAIVGPVARSTGVPMIWDCRGDSIAESEGRFGANAGLRILGKLRQFSLQHERSLAAKTCAAALFVSRPLAALCAGLLEGKPSFVVPCVAREDIFFFDPKQRERVRDELGYDKNDRVLIYSGGLAAYQCLPQTAALFMAVQKIEPRTKLLVVTPNIAGARELLSAVDESSLKILSARVDEVNGYLNAADAAFMLRQPSPINRASFPTKFAEYCLAGLPVIMDDAVPDCAAYADRFGNRVQPEAQAVRQKLLNGSPRQNIASAAQQSLTRRATATTYSSIYGFG